VVCSFCSAKLNNINNRIWCVISILAVYPEFMLLILLRVTVHNKSTFDCVVHRDVFVYVSLRRNSLCASGAFHGLNWFCLDLCYMLVEGCQLWFGYESKFLA
jgi:hypothetical protein